jgi:hypothetical protein
MIEQVLSTMYSFSSNPRAIRKMHQSAQIHNLFGQIFYQLSQTYVFANDNRTNTTFSDQ